MADSWLRLHIDILDNPKIRELPPALFMAWTLTMAIAKRHEGILPEVSRYAFEMRISVSEAKKTLDKLESRGLIDKSGDLITMHDWDYWQFENGTSEKQRSKAAMRMQRFRDAKRNQGVTSDATKRNDKRNDRATQSVTNVTSNASRARTDSDSDSDTERNVTGVTANVTQPNLVCDALDRICALHPKPDGIAMGRKLLESELASAVNPQELAAKMERRHSIYVASMEGESVRFVKTLANWARDRSYNDPEPQLGARPNGSPKAPSMEEQTELARRMAQEQLAKRKST